LIGGDCPCIFSSSSQFVALRDRWKDPVHPFRHAPLFLKGVPTLLKHGTPQRLVEEECTNHSLLGMLFD
jgi:hypothetical protein